MEVVMLVISDKNSNNSYKWNKIVIIMVSDENSK